MAKLALPKMTTMKNKMDALRQKNPRQSASLGAVAALFAVLLVLTLVARGTAGAAMARVETGRPYRAAITRTVELNGTVATADGTPFAVPEGLTIRSIGANVGESVKPGDALLTFDEAEIQRKLAAAQAELVKLQTDYSLAQKSVQADPFATEQAQQQLGRAYDKVHEAYGEGLEAVDAANAARDSAESELNALLALPATPEQAAASDRDAKITAARQKLAAAEQAVQDTQKQAEDATEGMNDTAQSVEDSRNSAAHALEKEAETARDTTAANRAGAGITAVQIADQKDKIAALQALAANGGVYAAPYAGTVTRLDAVPGAQSTAVGGLLADAGVGSLLAITLDKDAAALAVVGTGVQVSQGSGGKVNAAITALATPDEEDGSVKATVRLPEGNWKAGAAMAELTLNAGQFDTCLPAASVNTDGEGAFVYKIEARDTVLGLQNVLVRIPVTTAATGDGVVAVTGALAQDDAVVTSADKPLAAGDRVRVAG